MVGGRKEFCDRIRDDFPGNAPNQKNVCNEKENAKPSVKMIKHAQCNKGNAKEGRNKAKDTDDESLHRLVGIKRCDSEGVSNLKR